MTRTQSLQELRRIGFKEAHGEWQAAAHAAEAGASRCGEEAGQSPFGPCVFRSKVITDSGRK